MEYERLSDAQLKRLEKLFGFYGNRLLVAGSETVVVPTMRLWYNRYKDFECRSSDIWVVSYPKSGTTWTQEMVWCILNNFDYDTAKEQLLMKRFPFFEWDGYLPEDVSCLDSIETDDPCAIGETWKILNILKDPRTIKSHLHLSMLPDGLQVANSKVIYICRDPRDVCVSYYYHSLKFDNYKGDFSDFFDLFLEDILFFSPYWRHVLDFWNMRNLKNVLFLRYEDLKDDLASNIKRVSSFLEKYVSEEELERLLDHLSFDKMKSYKSINNESIIIANKDDPTPVKFMRKGIVGDWKSHMNEDQIQKINRWIEDYLKNSDFPFYRCYDI